MVLRDEPPSGFHAPMDGRRPGVAFPAGVPELIDTATGLRLRALTEDDLPAVIEQSNDPDTARWTTVPQPYGMAEARAFLEQIQAKGWRDGSQAGFAVEVPIDGRPRYAGQLDLRFTEPGRGEVGFVTHPAMRGRGVMRAALGLLVPWAFATQGLHVIRWYAAVGNWGSRRAAEAAGFRHEGIGRHRVHLRTGDVDGWIASITPADLTTPAPRWLSLPDLRGERVVLREPRETDARRIGDSPAAGAALLERAREERARRSAARFALADPRTDACLGWVALHHLDQPARRLSVDGFVHPDARGRGVATEALRILTTYALAEWTTSIHLLVDTADPAGQRVAERAGWRRVGVLREAGPRPGRPAADLTLWAVP